MIDSKRIKILKGNFYSYRSLYATFWYECSIVKEKL